LSNSEKTSSRRDEATVIVHLGAGAHVNLRDKAIRSSDDYRGVTATTGLFVLSIYAALKGHDVLEIVGTMPWNHYGTCSVRELRAHFELLATTILDDDTLQPVDPLQEVHFDVVLPGLEDERLAVEGGLLDNVLLLATVEAWLDPHIDTFQSLFEPANADRITEESTMHRLTVDYTRYLRSRVVEVALFASERVGLHVGDTVLVNGEDGIPERRATVFSIDRGKVSLRFIDPVRATA
jgi:hypothetical protein